MGFNWSEYLTIAKELALRSDEAALRSALSRAYYAAFGTALERLAVTGHAISQTAEAHSEVCRLYKNADDGPLHYVGIEGVRLRQLRRWADYDRNVVFNDIVVGKAVSLAERTINAIRRLSPPPPPDEGAGK